MAWRPRRLNHSGRVLGLDTYIRSRVMSEEGGQTLGEYSLILAFISIVAVAVMQTVGVDVMSVFTSLSTELEE